MSTSATRAASAPAHSRCFIHTVDHPRNKPTFPRRENWGPEGLSGLPKATQWMGGWNQDSNLDVLVLECTLNKLFLKEWESLKDFTLIKGFLSTQSFHILTSPTPYKSFPVGRQPHLTYEKTEVQSGTWLRPHSGRGVGIWAWTSLISKLFYHSQRTCKINSGPSCFKMNVQSCRIAMRGPNDQKCAG